MLWLRNYFSHSIAHEQIDLQLFVMKFYTSDIFIVKLPRAQKSVYQLFLWCPMTIRQLKLHTTQHARGN